MLKITKKAKKKIKHQKKKKQQQQEKTTTRKNKTKTKLLQTMISGVGWGHNVRSKFYIAIHREKYLIKNPLKDNWLKKL